jgi:superfamily II DNA or RNA helicase
MIIDEGYLYAWHRHFLAWYRNKRLVCLNSPPGSGKSTAVVYLAADHVRHGGKVLVVVPTIEIASNFIIPCPGEDVRVRFKDGIVVSWSPLEPEAPKKIKNLVEFLTKGAPGVMVATHQAIAMAAGSVVGAPSIFDGLMLVVDEAHHVKDDMRGSELNYSKLGRIVKVAIARAKRDGDGTGKVVLVTATPFRGDRMPIIDEEVLEADFDVYTRTMKDHLKDAKIKSVNVHLLTYPPPVNEYDQAIDVACRQVSSLVKDGRLVTNCGVLFMPHTLSRCNDVCQPDLLSNKAFQLEVILDVLRKNGRTTLDLVTQSEQEANRAKLRESREQGTLLTENTIVAMNLFTEGTDYAAVDHVMSIGYQGSITRMVHRIGRATRPHRGKKEVHVFILMPCGADRADAEEFNRFLKTICMVMVAEQICLVRDDDVGGVGVRGGSVGEVVFDNRSPSDKLEDLEGAIRGAFGAVELAERDERGNFTPRGIESIHGAGQESAFASAAKRGDDDGSCKAARLDARNMMPRLLSQSVRWFADEICMDVVDGERSRPAHHVSVPINVALLRKLQDLIVKHQVSEREAAIRVVEEYVEEKRHTPIKTDKAVFASWKKLINDRHVWYVDGFKQRMRRRCELELV